MTLAFVDRCIQAQSGRIKYITLFVLIVFVALPVYRWLNIDICPLHRWLGMPCPTCGVTRATMALMRGEVVAAFILNPLWVIGIFSTIVLFLCDMCKPLNLKKIIISHRVMVSGLIVGCVLSNWIYLIVVNR